MNVEGVIRFRADCQSGIACAEVDTADFTHWRSKLRRRGLLGQNPLRYGGLGFGNLSKQMPSDNYLITGSQTGHLETLTTEQFARVTGFDPEENRVCSIGLVQPSSETMTHLAVYRTHPTAHYVFHVHSPEIWNARTDLNLPATPAKVEAGTVEMYREVVRLLSNRENRVKGLLAMDGHLDGILSWGETPAEAGNNVLLVLAQIARQRSSAT